IDALFPSHLKLLMKGPAMQKKSLLRILVALALALTLFWINVQAMVSYAAAPAAKPPTKTKVPTTTPTLTPTATATPSPTPIGATSIQNIIPIPVSVTSSGGTFSLPGTAAIYVNPGTSEMLAIGQYLADKLNPSTGYGLTVIGTTSTPPNGNIYLTTVGGSSALGTEGYDLTVTTNLVTLQAFQPTGLFRGLQTIRQMFPPTIEKST